MSAVIRESLQITLGQNDTPSTARFTLKPGSTAPPLYAPVVIALGSIENGVFYGTVVHRTFRAVSAAHDPFIDLVCVDDLWLLNRRLVNRIWYGWTISDIVLDIISGFTSGLSSAGVKTITTVVPVFVAADERPTALFRRLVLLAQGGGFYVHHQIVHFFDAAGETGPSAPTPPVPLTNTLGTLKSFTRVEEGRELRTRTIVKGLFGSTDTLIAIPSGSQGLFGVPTLSAVPIMYGQFFPPVFAGETKMAYIGAQVLSYFAKNGVTGVQDRPHAIVTSAVAIGATSIPVENSGALWSYGMTLGGVTNRYIVFHHTSADPVTVAVGRVTAGGAGNPLLIDLIPTSGFGSVQVPIEAGTLVFLLDALWTTDPLADTYDVGTTVGVRTVVDDVAAQGVIAAAEGGDGVHEYTITQSKDTSYAEDEVLGQADLDAFKAGLEMPTWVTRDMNARPGARQVFDITGANAYADTLTITRTDLDFPLDNAPPFRRCAASAVTLAQLVDALNASRQG